MVDVACALDSDSSERIPNSSHNRWTAIRIDVAAIQVCWAHAGPNIESASVCQLMSCAAQQVQGILEGEGGDTETARLNCAARHDPERCQCVAHRSTI